ncbi:MAG: terminase gpA endonuclease subunit [Verrucomicrobiia bacterium]|jgi:hypothetical protein
MLTIEQKQVAVLVKKLKDGREPLTADERTRLEAYKRQQRGADVAERMRRSTALRMDIASKPDWKQISDRRAACANGLSAFIREYLGHRFTLPNSPDQIECLDRIQAVALGKAGERQAVASPRGDGKTERTLAATVWAILYGHHRYVVVIGANLDKAKKIVTEIEQELADNDLLLLDWPYLCEPIRRAYAKPNRAKFLTMDGEPIRLECRTCKLVLPTWSGDPAKTGGSIIEAAGILGVRGLRHTTASGEVLRPTLALIDDPQTFEVAASPEQVAKIEAVIQGDILKMAGPRRRVSAFLNVTVIKNNDVADRFLDHKRHPEWRGIRKKMIYQWPKRKDLWEQYAEHRRNGILEGDKGATATAFYLAHRAEMDEGATVGWEHRYSPDQGEHSALQHAYNILIDDSEAAFMAECQNEPLQHTAHVYEIKPEIVASRVNKMPAGEAPALARVITAFVDVNRYGLTWAACAWLSNMTGYVIGYGIHPEGRPVFDPKNPGTETEAQALFRCLSELGAILTRRGAFMRAGEPAPLNCLMIDCGYLSETVLQFHRTAPLPTMIIPSRGRAARTFNTRQNAKTVRRGDAWRVDEWTGGNVLIHNSDFHRMMMHQAWLLPHGAPGGLTIFGDSPAQHMAFARQITAERLAEYVKGDVCDHFVWRPVPGERNDFLDALVGARVGALYLLNVSGQQQLSQGAPAQPAQPSATPRPATQRPRAPAYVAGWEPQRGGFWHP